MPANSESGYWYIFIWRGRVGYLYFLAYGYSHNKYLSWGTLLTTFLLSPKGFTSTPKSTSNSSLVLTLGSSPTEAQSAYLMVARWGISFSGTVDYKCSRGCCCRFSFWEFHLHCLTLVCLSLTIFSEDEVLDVRVDSRLHKEAAYEDAGYSIFSSLPR